MHYFFFVKEYDMHENFGSVKDGTAAAELRKYNLKKKKTSDDKLLSKSSLSLSEKR